MIKDVEDSWKAVHLSTHSEVVAYRAHEPHEGCTGNLVIVKVDGNPDVRKAIAELIARSPSMLALLEKALPIIEEEAERRTLSYSPKMDSYWLEMNEIRDEISAEIDKAYGREGKRNG